MYLERVRIFQYGPFDEMDISLVSEPGQPRLLAVIYGDGGTGKSSIIEAIAHTRPGKTTPLPVERRRDDGESYVICDWRLTAEDPARPHGLQVVSPNVRFEDPDEVVRRREQAFFDRRAAEGTGFVFVEIPSQRYFSRATLGLNDPARAMSRYDARGTNSGYDATRPDLTRPCKQAIAYAAISAALAGNDGDGVDARALGDAMEVAVGEIALLGGFFYRGVDSHTFEPLFDTPGGSIVRFDELPTQVRHMISFVAIPVRAFWAAYEGVDPREAEGVIAVDDFELHLGPRQLEGLLPALRRILPRAQWILTTGSPYAAAGAEVGSLFALRRQAESDLVELFSDTLALTH